MQKVDSVLENQSFLPELNNPQVELHLLRSCLSLCQINNLLRTVPPGTTDHHWTRFDTGTRRSLELITKTSLPDASWQQATLPMRMGGLGLRQTATTSAAAFLGSCQTSLELSTRLLVQNKKLTTHVLVPTSPMFVESPCTPISIPGEENALVRYRQVLASYGADGHPNNSSGESQRVLQRQLYDALLSNLKDTSSLRDKARLNTESSVHAAAWLRAIPNVKLGLSMAPHEITVALKLWLGIPIISPLQSIRCSCGCVIDCFGDHVLGCGHGSLRSKRHDALRDIIYHALLVDNEGAQLEQRCGPDSTSRPGEIFHPDFADGRPGYFDVSIRITMQPAYVAKSAISAGAAAMAGEEEKDHRHDSKVNAAGGYFYPIIVESFGLWTSSSLATLKVIASKTTAKTRISFSRAVSNLLQQFQFAYFSLTHV